MHAIDFQFYENLKNQCKNRFFQKKAKNSKKYVFTMKKCTQIQNFKRNFLENYNASKDAVKTKNASFFMNFPNIIQRINYVRICIFVKKAFYRFKLL